MSKQRIIVIEDQEDLAALYEAALTNAGYEVSKAYTGEEGHAEFADRGADAVLLDMTLPEMHGLVTLQKIRAINTRVPIVVVTGETSEETRKQSERLGVHEYLSKPVDYGELVRIFRGALSDERNTTEEYEVVTLRLNKRIVECLTSIDENLERAVAALCEKQFK